jgi:quercetin dioxygenase-like cupin family protein
MQRWDLRRLDTPGGSRSPLVLHSEEGVARAVLIGLDAGQELGDHEVKERAFVVVIDGRVHIDAAGESFDADPGELFAFEPEERHSVSSADGARILLVLAPWPGRGHFRGEKS